MVKPAERAAELCKADLLTGIVGEFPDAAGRDGWRITRDSMRRIVRVSRHRGAVSTAIHGRARFLPHLSPQVLSLADRLDNLAAFFHVGIVPTGSEDPFALRRHATAMVRILLEREL